MLATVGICTWNRASLLRQTLQQMTQLIVPPKLTWELIVVDNNCTDQTTAVLSDFRERLPLRVVHEARQGHSNARNAAVAAARGKYLIWTDDDVLVDEHWLQAYAEAFRRHSEASILGGPIAPWFEGRPPNWLLEVMPTVGAAYAVQDLVTSDEPITMSRTPFGANLAFRTDALGALPFDPKLGRVGSAMLSGDETAVIESLLKSGHCGRWVPNALVRHYIPASRQNTSYLRRYYRGSGATSARIYGEVPVPFLWGKPRWLWREVVTREVAYWLHRLYAPPGIWIADLKAASIAWGKLGLDWRSLYDHRSDGMAMPA